MFDFSNRVALISGGSRGIGASTALMYAQSGANVAILYRRDRKSAERVAGQIRRIGRRALIIRCNVELPTECRRAAKKIDHLLGPIDFLVNSAGIWKGDPIGQLSLSSWNRTMAINLSGTFNLISAVVPSMKRRRFGRIINVSSTAGQRGEPLHADYAASKGGIIAFTKSIAVELIEFNISVNCVAPGWVETEMVSHIFRIKSRRKEVLRSIPRGKIAKPDDIAGPILFLSSPMAEHIVGEIININGGSLLCG